MFTSYKYHVSQECYLLRYSQYNVKSLSHMDSMVPVIYTFYWTMSTDWMRLERFQLQKMQISCNGCSDTAIHSPYQPGRIYLGKTWLLQHFSANDASMNCTVPAMIQFTCDILMCATTWSLRFTITNIMIVTWLLALNSPLSWHFLNVVILSAVDGNI